MFPNSVPGVPYYVTIGAINEAGQGENTTVIAFTAVKGTKDHEKIKNYYLYINFISSYSCSNDDQY